MTVQLDVSNPEGEMKALLESIRKGDEVVLSSDGKTVARVLPVPHVQVDRKKVTGMMKGQIQMAPDFDTLPEDELEQWYK